MDALITNTRTKEVRLVPMLEWHAGFNPNSITLEQVADRLIKRIACTYPKAYKLVLNKDTAIDIMAGNVTKCIFEIRRIENLKDYDDSFLC
jgi:hypothetical protein